MVSSPVLSSSPTDRELRVDTRSTPTVEPAYRCLTERDVLGLLEGKEVPGVDPTDPTVQLLRAGLPTKPARTAFGMARRQGFLQVELGYAIYPDARTVRQLEEVWGIWCTIRAHPPITLTVLPDGEGRLACDLAPLERGWTDEERASIRPLLVRAWVRPGYRWTLTATSLEVAGLEAGDAVALARSLAWALTRRGNRDDIGCA